MRKSVFIGAKAVGKVGDIGGVSLGLFAVVKITLSGGVYKVRGLCQQTPGVIRLLIPFKNLFIIPVNPIFLPSIHTTYYKLQLIRLNICY